MMEYFDLLELPEITGVSDKQVRYAKFLRDKEVNGNRDYYESIACSQWHNKLNYSEMDETTKIVLSSGNAGLIINTLKEDEPKQEQPKTNEQYKRAIILLKATSDILAKLDDTPYVLNFFEQTAVWDGVDCDGYCLMEEVNELLEEVGVKEQE